MTDSIHVCPICHSLASESDDYGWSLYCSHEPYQSIEPLEVPGEMADSAWTFPLPDPEEWKATVGAEMLAAQEEKARKRAEWLALSCDERVAIREKQREAGPTTFMMGEILRDQLASSIFSRLGGSKTITVRCPKCRDAGCENSYTKPNPDYPRKNEDFWRGGFSIQVEPGSSR